MSKPKELTRFGLMSKVDFRSLEKVAVMEQTSLDRERALRVLETFLLGTENHPGQLTQWEIFMADTIRRDLDEKSIGHFVELVLQFHDKLKRSKIGSKRKKPTQEAVKEYWARWQDEPDLYASTEDFARDMMEKYGPEAEGVSPKDVIKNIETPRRWHRKWRNAATTEPDE